ncbi:hypothetical protein GCK72_023056 [Caenorhabditis remanei]|uniref:Uncharacterized protein n=1 Tax=Caenorhabditis remanei TaxID=31234 RepID=A0A6A5FVZ8_CAERE|nr:hypothetical protein GCK72_023056 [Caenorhabditis remanei]KAF1746599.1 hypothetical protein GCK72_023056 [Caenorhabditis remanei]
MILTTILVVVGLCFGGVGAEIESIQSDRDKCCQYPILLATANDANVTRQNFKCAEPISLKCHRDKNGQFVKLAIAGTNDQFKTFTLLAESEMTLLERTVICSSSLFRSKWHLDGSEDEFSSFTCLKPDSGTDKKAGHFHVNSTGLHRLFCVSGGYNGKSGVLKEDERTSNCRSTEVSSTVSFVTCDSKGRINSSKFSELWSRENGGFNRWKVDGREEVRGQEVAGSSRNVRFEQK